jgi:ketosteroid isomerase-like protein
MMNQSATRAKPTIVGNGVCRTDESFPGGSDMEQHDALKQELLAREQDYWNAIKEKNARVATSLSDDPCIVVGAQGVSELSRNALTKMLEGAAYELRGFSLEDVHFRRLGDDVVALAYRVNEDLTVDGERVKLEAFDSSVWVKRGGEWVCVVHTESPAGDPFGRH